MKQFSGPIPGQSLTNPPKNYAWERPPEINDPEEAIQMHLTRLSEPEMLGSVLDLLELEELDVQTLVTGIMRGAVASGIHSVDVGLIVAPIVHEYIKQAAKATGIEAEDGFEDKAAKERQRQYAVAKRARKMLADMGVKPKEDVKEISMEEPAEAEGMGAMEEMPMEAPVESKGLMSRGAM